MTDKEKDNDEPTAEAWYLSFATTEAFLGACIVEAPTLDEAIARARFIGIHPGGQVLGRPIPIPEPPHVAKVPKHKLLQRDEIPGARTLGESCGIN